MNKSDFVTLFLGNIVKLCSFGICPDLLMSILNITNVIPKTSYCQMAINVGYLDVLNICV